MTITISKQRQIYQVAEGAGQRRPLQNKALTSPAAAPTIQAGLTGGARLALLMVAGLMLRPERPLLTIFLTGSIIFAYIVIGIKTGVAANLAAVRVGDSAQAGQLGWVAGYWAGIVSGITAMFFAAGGWMMVDFGQQMLYQFPPEQLARWSSHITPDTVALAGRVFGALLVYGFIGSLLTALLASMGGLLHEKLTPQR